MNNINPVNFDDLFGVEDAARICGISASSQAVLDIKLGLIVAASDYLYRSSAPLGQSIDLINLLLNLDLATCLFDKFGRQAAVVVCAQLSGEGQRAFLVRDQGLLRQNT